MNKKNPDFSVGVMCSRYLFSRGSDGSAAGGGSSDLSEWPRSADEEAAPSATKMPGTATGSPPSIVSVHELNFCVRDGREPECCRWQNKRGRSVCRDR